MFLSGGKFAQRDNLVTKEMISNEDVYSLLTNPSRKILALRPVHNQYFAAHCLADAERHSSRFAALHHAAFVTSYGRLLLYSLMEKVGDKLQYNDTDSIIFLCDKDEKNPLEHLVTGYLGQLTSEVPEGQRIAEVMCSGPKFYSIKYADGSTVVKAKGIHQTEETSELNFDAIDSIVQGHFSGTPAPITVPQSTIARPQVGTIITRNTNKTVQFVNRKTIVEGVDYETAINRPFGYIPDEC